MNMSARVLCFLAVAVLCVGGATSLAYADTSPMDNIRSLWAEAREGNEDAAYRLGEHYETRYWLAEREPEIRGNPADLIVAYALFRIAQRSESLDSLYGRNETEFRLKRILGEEVLVAAIAALPEWMWPQESSPKQERRLNAPGPGEAARIEASVGESPSQQTVNGKPHATATTQKLAVPPVTQPSLEALIDKGNSHLDAGELEPARGFFERAAEQGSGEAAMLVGMTFDPHFLEPLGLMDPGPDARRATMWYLRAIDLGNEEAKARVQTLSQWIDKRTP